MRSASTPDKPPGQTAFWFPRIVAAIGFTGIFTKLPMRMNEAPVNARKARVHTLSVR